MVYDLRRNYEFKLTKVSQPIKRAFISMPNKSILIPRKDFARAIQETRANVANGIGPHGVTYILSEDVRDRIRENQKINNNVIELR